MSRSEKILVVDDESNILNLLEKILSAHFRNVDSAENGKKACEKLKKKRYDLVLTDIVMPVVNGIEVLKQAKELYDDIIVLILTGQATLNTAIDSVNLGADEYITKPFEIKNLLKIIDAHLERQRLVRENIKLHRQTERDRNQLKKNVVELSILYNFTRNLTYNFDIAEVYKTILETLSEAVSNDFCSIYEIRRNTITVKTSTKLSKKILAWLENLLLSEAKREYGEHIDEKDIQFDIHETGHLSTPGKSVNSFFNIVLKDKDETFGVLNVSRFAHQEFSEDDKRFLARIAEQSSNNFTQLQKVIESQKDKIQRIIENLPDGVIMHDQRDDSILINPAAVDMISPSTRGISRINRNTIESLLNFRFNDIYDKNSHDEKSFIHEIKIPQGDNRFIILDAHVGFLSPQSFGISRDGMPQGILMVLRDVTKEREVDRLKTEFISNVSHELRTPAAVVKEFTSILRDGIAGPTTDTQNEYLQIMTNNIDRLFRIIDNLLNISRLEAGMLKLHKKQFSLKFVLQNVVRTMNVRYAEKGMTIKEEIQEDLPEIYADPDAITQILLNCLDNARKFSPEGSDVILRAYVRDAELYLCVQDFGRGIPKKGIDKLFMRFYRIEDPAQRDEARSEGSGLGLSIVKEFINLHGGTINVESELNKGTTFHITIPLQPVEENSGAGGE